MPQSYFSINWGSICHEKNEILVLKVQHLWTCGHVDRIQYRLLAVVAFVSSSGVYTTLQATDWNKYDERLLKAVENGDVDKVTSTLKKGAVATKLDADGRCSWVSPLNNIP